MLFGSITTIKLVPAILALTELQPVRNEDSWLVNYNFARTHFCSNRTVHVI